MSNCALTLDFLALLCSSHSADTNIIFRRVRKIAQSDNELRHVRLSVRLFVRPQGITRLPLEGFSRNLIFQYFFFSKICRENSTFNKI